MRGLKLGSYDNIPADGGRTPPGVRGLKLKEAERLTQSIGSHPAWGAWIETFLCVFFIGCRMSHPAWGAWIETQPTTLSGIVLTGRTPPGVRGLKRNTAVEICKS